MSETRGDKILMKLLEAIDTEMALKMLNDLRDPEKRTPQLYQAVNRFLDRHDFGIKSLMVDSSVLGELQETAVKALEEFDKMSREDDEWALQ